MIPIKHDIQPQELKDYLIQNPSPTVKDFDSVHFKPVKRIVKKQLYNLQGKKCVYCERHFADLKDIQVEHIKPKSGRTPYKSLCFTYTNYAASCIQNTQKSKRTCGQNKEDKLLSIEPTNLQCNDWFTLSTSGEIRPLATSTRQQQHAASTTIGILGLNKAHLVLLRKKRITSLISLIKMKPSLATKFIDSGDFSYILKKLS
ncbi:TIGR02646 family protein [Vibrio mediterranei]|nr:TIGR02646 family protein [Vibrio mediterranei]